MLSSDATSEHLTVMQRTYLTDASNVLYLGLKQSELLLCTESTFITVSLEGAYCTLWVCSGITRSEQYRSVPAHTQRVGERVG